MKKIIALVLSLVMAVSVFATSAFAAEPGITSGVIYVDGSVSTVEKEMNVYYQAQEDLSNVVGFQFVMEFPAGFAIESVTTAINGWDADFDAETNRIILMNDKEGSNFVTLENGAAWIGDQCTIATIKLATTAAEGNYAIGWTLEDLTTQASDKVDPVAHIGDGIGNGIEFTFCSHSATQIVGAYPAKCGVQGYTGDTHCSACGTLLAQGTYTTALAHSYGAYKVTTQATTSKNGVQTATCTRSGCGHKITKTIYKASSIKLSASSYTYDGKAKKPSVVIKDSTGKKLTSADYSVSYASGRKAVGKYKVTVTFKGNYSGSKTLYFTIVPKNIKLSSVKAGSKSLTIKWSKTTSHVKGYEIQYSTSSSFSKKTTKTVKVTSYKTSSKTIKKLKAKKKYYVRIRAYKTVSGSTYYSKSWSSKKYATTKK